MNNGNDDDMPELIDDVDDDEIIVISLNSKYTYTLLQPQSILLL